MQCVARQTPQLLQKYHTSEVANMSSQFRVNLVRERINGQHLKQAQFQSKFIEIFFIRVPFNEL